MADRDDEIMSALAHSISVTYSLLVDVCQALPVPVSMPTDRRIPTSAAVPAIRRAAALAGEQPMGEDQEAHLFTGCIHLLAAIDLYALCATRYDQTRAEGVGVNLLHADDALRTLLVWLLANAG
ncbi:hypothetical protein SSP24_06280 [Streptomyces spinoverrucosus]|uniref:Uncharacterized protein n=1 Tax=Streptomyces spinoverrucosus TaxID=284043 RepID=A0A4Y3V9F2_9ACTN|nr:hypothetical protein [Streptomyces spinoverrucosus]GEC02973.1 hypothetical protein SSP24_06280 [Streptomyces spinoverrucosus]GHB39174.1 hypothetical protein GCM10010397_06310 [Streptomyces spinoverrucosus]